jgi:biopolymer transport protein ExbD
MLKKKKSKKMEANGADVNITSLLDVLTVLLFFLIKSASVSSLQLTPPEGLKLPTAQLEEEPKEAIKIALSKDQLIVNEKVMMKLTNGRFPAGEIAEDKRTIKPLQEFLRKEYQKKKDFYKDVAQGDIDKLPAPTLLIQADHKLQFKTMKYLLHTAAISGFGDYQFVVQGEAE